MHGFDELNECMWTWIDTDLDEYSSNCSNMAAAGQNLMMDASRQTSNKQNGTMDGLIRSSSKQYTKAYNG